MMKVSWFIRAGSGSAGTLYGTQNARLTRAPYAALKPTSYTSTRHLMEKLCSPNCTNTFPKYKQILLIFRKLMHDTRLPPWMNMLADTCAGSTGP
eukprot:4611208-Karenia_brevis.AAC.1